MNMGNTYNNSNSDDSFQFFNTNSRDNSDNINMINDDYPMFNPIPENYSYMDSKYNNDYQMDSFMDDYRFDKIHIDLSPLNNIKLSNNDFQQEQPQSPLIQSTNPINLLKDIKKSINISNTNDKKSIIINTNSNNNNNDNNNNNSIIDPVNTTTTTMTTMLPPASTSITIQNDPERFASIGLENKTFGFETNGSNNDNIIQNHDGDNNDDNDSSNSDFVRQLEDDDELEVEQHELQTIEHASNSVEEEEHVCYIDNQNTHEPCMKKFSRPYDLVRHQKTIHASKKKIFRCLLCINELGDTGYMKTFSRGDALSRHIKVKHNLSMDSDELQNAMKYAKENVEFA